MNKPQYITAISGLFLVCILFFFGKTEADFRKNNKPESARKETISAAGMYNEDSMLAEAKSKITSQQVVRLNELENSISRGDIKDQQLKVYHQLSHFWGDSARLIDPYAWYEAEAARLDNSEKTLIFAARLFLGGLREEQPAAKKRWKALQAKELYERSLKINPSNDSARVELGMCQIYGGIAETPMEGIQNIRNVLSRDSVNMYALMALADASQFSGQYDKAIERLLKINSIAPENLDAILKLADIYSNTGKKKEAVEWYRKSLPLLQKEEWKAEVQKRIDELK